MNNPSRVFDFVVAIGIIVTGVSALYHFVMGRADIATFFLVWMFGMMILMKLDNLPILGVHIVEEDEEPIAKKPTSKE